MMKNESRRTRRPRRKPKDQPDELPTSGSLVPIADVVEVPFEPKRPMAPTYLVQIQFGSDDWRGSLMEIEVLELNLVKVGSHTVAPTATVRGGWRFFEAPGVSLKIRESDWQEMLKAANP